MTLSHEQVDEYIWAIRHNELTYLQDADRHKQICDYIDTLRAEVESLKRDAKGGLYKDKHAYQWHDEYTAALKAWHEEVDDLKVKATKLTDDVQYWIKKWQEVCQEKDTQVAALT